MPQSEWSKRPVHWEDDDHHYWSIVFTWDLWEWARTIQPELDGREIVVGGPAVRLMPEVVPDWVTIGDPTPALHRHNPQATRTSYGCPRRCRFCAVPTTEGPLVELEDWPLRPVVMDNNLLGCSVAHFDRVIDRLKALEWCDLQGLDARLLTQHHAERFSELGRPILRMGFDHSREEGAFLGAYELLRTAGLPLDSIRAYVLIGFKDTPSDALYRLKLIEGLGVHPFPMRYQPLDTRKRNEYVGKAWTHQELDRYVSYWANLRFTRGVPFEEYEHHGTRTAPS